MEIQEPHVEPGKMVKRVEIGGNVLEVNAEAFAAASFEQPNIELVIKNELEKNGYSKENDPMIKSLIEIKNSLAKKLR